MRLQLGFQANLGLIKSFTQDLSRQLNTTRCYAIQEVENQITISLELTGNRTNAYESYCYEEKFQDSRTLQELKRPKTSNQSNK